MNSHIRSFNKIGKLEDTLKFNFLNNLILLLIGNLKIWTSINCFDWFSLKSIMFTLIIIVLQNKNQLQRDLYISFKKTKILKIRSA